MPKSPADPLSRRERQLMDVIYRLGRATAAEVRALLPDPPSYSAVRALLRILEEKGHLRHEQDGPRYAFRPTLPRDQARRDALRRLVQTYFGGSITQAIAALIDDPSTPLTAEELDQITRLIDHARAGGR